MSAVDAIPTRLLLQPSRMGIADGQRRLSQAQAESASGRHYDIGLALGAQTGGDIAIRLHLASLEEDVTRANLASVRADTVQTSLSGLSNLADRFRSTLTGARNSGDGRTLSASLARSSLDALRDSLSVSQEGQYLFSGTATDTPPLVAYDNGPRQAVIDAFQASFGFPPDDPAAAGLSADDVSSFLDGTFAAQFSGSAWTSTWSRASDEVPTFRTQSGSRATLTTTANAPFAQMLAQAFTIMDVLGSSKINQAAFTSSVDKSLAIVSEAQVQVGEEQARLGIGQALVKDTRSGLEQRKTSLTTALSSLENVDPYEAATRVNLLMNQLESSYALTGRISRMSLLTYL